MKWHKASTSVRMFLRHHFQLFILMIKCIRISAVIKISVSMLTNDSYCTFYLTLNCWWRLRPSSHEYVHLLSWLVKRWWHHHRKYRLGLRIIHHMVGALVDDHSLVPEMEACEWWRWEIVVLCTELETILCHFHNVDWIVLLLSFVKVLKQQDGWFHGADDHILSAYSYTHGWGYRGWRCRFKVALCFGGRACSSAWSPGLTSSQSRAMTLPINTEFLLCTQLEFSIVEHFSASQSFA